MTWTTTQLRALFARREQGASTRELAAQVGVSAKALRDAWRRVGLDAHAVQQREVRVQGPRWHRQSRAYSLHHVDGLTWEEVHARLGGEGTVASLRSQVTRWARRVGLDPQWRGGTERASEQRIRKRRCAPEK